MAFASESSLPGDFLYPVKVEVVEPLMGMVSLTQESKSMWEIELTHRRYLEAWALVTEGELKNSQVDSLLSHIEEHVEHAFRAIEKIEEGDGIEEALKMQSDLEATLQGHAQALDVLGQQGKQSTRLTKLSVRTRYLERRSERIRESMEEDLFQDTTVQLQEIAEGEGSILDARVQALHEELENLDGQELLPETEECIVEIQEALDDVQDALENGDYQEAYVRNQEGERMVTEVEVLLDLQDAMASHEAADEAITTEDGEQEDENRREEEPVIPLESQSDLP